MLIRGRMYESNYLPYSRLFSIRRINFRNWHARRAFKTIRSAYTRLKLFTNLSTLPKRRIKMAAQSCAFSTDANAENESNFWGQNH